MNVWIRRPQQDDFARWLQRPVPAYWRLLGEGGGGKSSLLDRFRDAAEDERLPAILMPANGCVAVGERDGVTLLLNLDVENAPEFARTRGILLGVKTAFQAALDETGTQAKANWDRISELAECGVEGAGAILRGVRDVAKVAEIILGKASDTGRAEILAKPEEALLKALAKDMRAGGVWLIDTWEQADGQPFDTRLDFPSPGRLRTPPRGKPRPVPLKDWLDDVAAWLFEKVPALVLIAGREAPGELGRRSPPLTGLRERTLPLTEAEIGDYLQQALPDLDHGDAPLADLRRRSGGVPLLVEWIARLVGEEAREQGGAWRWAHWPALVRAFTDDDRYGLIHYAIERVVEPATRVADIWKLALVDELTPEVADIVFPPAGRDGPAGRQLLREFERLGIAHRPRGGDRWTVHDVTREALESYARHEGLLDPVRNLDLHRALADHYDRLAGWTEEMEMEGIRLERKKLMDPSVWWVPMSFSADGFSNLLRATYHVALLSLSGNSALAQKEVDNSMALELAKRICGSFSFSPPSIRVMAASYLGILESWQIEEFLSVLRDEGGIERGYLMEDAKTFEMLRKASSVEDLADVDIHKLVVKYYDRPFVIALLAESEAVPLAMRDLCLNRIIETANDIIGLGGIARLLTDVRGAHDEAEAFYRRAVEADPNDANTLGNFALFLKNVRGSHDEAEAFYRRAVEADPKLVGNLGNFANFLWKVRGSYDGAEAFYRRAVEADPNHANILGNFAEFLWQARSSHDEAEAFYRRAVEADPKLVGNLGNFANFLWKVRGSYDGAEAFYRRAVEADPNHANILGNFAEFLWQARSSHDEAEAMYRRAVEADPKLVGNLGNFANFLWKVRGSYDEAEAFYRRVVETAPNNANTLANFAGFLLARDRIDEGVEVWRRALEGSDKWPSGLALELWFYAYAHLPDRREQALGEVVARLERGERSPGFDLSANAAAARRQGHPDPERVDELARLISA